MKKILISVLFLLNTTVWAHNIGEYFQGGIIFWIDELSEHGLIAAVDDQGIDVPWFNDNYSITHTVRDGIFAGKYNTAHIIDVQGAPIKNYAAQIANSYRGGGYDDWYLPSRSELNLMFKNKDIIGGFNLSLNNKYWSSTEYPANPLLGVCVQSFKENHQFVSLKENLSNVRAIRSF